MTTLSQGAFYSFGNTSSNSTELSGLTPRPGAKPVDTTPSKELVKEPSISAIPNAGSGDSPARERARTGSLDGISVAAFREGIQRAEKRLLCRKNACLGGDGSAMEWMQNMWIKPLKSENCKPTRQVCNPLELVLGDNEKLGAKTKKPASLLVVTPKPKSGLRRLLEYERDGELKACARHHLYYPNGEILSASIDDEKWPPGKKEKFLALDEMHTIVVGNGGFGSTGGIKHLAQKYNEYLTSEGQDPVNVIWRAGDSNHNMLVIDQIDLAITYEPVLEQRLVNNRLVKEVLPLFVNFFALVIPCTNVDCDPLKLKDFIRLDRSSLPKPYEVLMYIIVAGFMTLARGGKPQTYASRWNFSAMGLRDHFIMLMATKRLASLICKEDYSNNFEEYILRITKQAVDGTLKDFMWKQMGEYAISAEWLAELEWCSPDAAGQIYLTWHKLCVDHHRVAFPSQIVAAATKKGQYHMNDMSQLEPENFKDITKDEPCPRSTKSGYFYQVREDLRGDYAQNPYANPGDLILPTRSDHPDSAAKKFFDWLKANRRKPALWEGFQHYGWAVSPNLEHYDEFNPLLDTQVALQVDGEVPDAKYARANHYFWSQDGKPVTHSHWVYVGPFPEGIIISREASDWCQACVLTRIVRESAGLYTSGDEVVLLADYCHSIIAPVRSGGHPYLRVTFIDSEDLIGDISLSQMAAETFTDKARKKEIDWSVLGSGIPKDLNVLMDSE